MAEYALRLANGADTAARVRASDALGLTPNGTVRARGGLRPDGGGAVTVVAGTMNVQVTAFSCWVDASPAGQIGYPFVCDATKTLAIAAGDATQVRVDTVAVVVKENAFDGSGATTATLQIVQGTPGAGAPAMPTSACIPLRDINVPAGASAGSGGLAAGALGSDRRTYTAALGGVLPCSSDPTSTYDGQVIYRTDAQQFKVRKGGQWQWLTPSSMADSTGWVAVTPASGVTGTLAYRVVGGVCYVYMDVSYPSTAQAVTRPLAAAGAIPAAVAPAVVKRSLGSIGTTIVRADVNADGSLSAVPLTSAATGLSGLIVSFPAGV